MDELILRGRMVRCNRLTDIHMVRVGVTGNIDHTNGGKKVLRYVCIR